MTLAVDNSMMVLIASDIHSSPRHLATTPFHAEIPGACAVVFNGDIVPNSIDSGTVNARQVATLQREYLAGPFLSEIRAFKERYPNGRIYADLGNDDFWCNRDLLIRSEREGILTLMHDRVQPLAPGIDVVATCSYHPLRSALRIRSESTGVVRRLKGA